MYICKLLYSFFANSKKGSLKSGKAKQKDREMKEEIFYLVDFVRFIILISEGHSSKIFFFQIINSFNKHIV